MIVCARGTVLATGDRFVKILGFADNTCQFLLTDQLGSSGMEA